jgi:MerR family transcriptional regulator, copper efflux regulator
MREIAELLDLWRDRRRPSRKVKALVSAHLRDLERRIAELQAMKGTLEGLAQHCHGDERPDCPILERLEQS